MFGNSLNRKEQIAKAAVDVFFEKGFKETSLQDIAIKSKISKAGIYHYFKSKSDILAHLLLGFTEKALRRLFDAIQEAQNQHLSPKQVLTVLIETYTKNMMNNRKISLIILRERHQLTSKHKKELLDKERLVFQTVRDQLRQVPDINKNFNINIIAFQIISMIHWMGYWFDSKGPLSEGEVLDQMLETIFSGILEQQA